MKKLERLKLSKFKKSRLHHKKLSISLIFVVLAGLSITLTNCKKIKNQEPISETTVVNQSDNRSETFISQYRIFTRTLGSYACSSRGGNCLAEVVITGTVDEGFSSVIGSNNGEANFINSDDVDVKPSREKFKNIIEIINSQKENDIKLIFKKHLKMLSKHVPIEKINAITNGEETVKVVLNSNGLSHFVIFSKNDVTTLVLPIVFKK